MLKIGYLVFNKQALKNLALLFFLIGLPYGFLIAYIQDNGVIVYPAFLVYGLFIYNFSCFFLLKNRIARNIIELNN
ncbi:hypothetical protein CLW00_10314 [Mongoliibacter ruber]|uniref:Uncharacterized protein n=1 Tax=Mongoliibacter ruber TaxID=1750599 RepID=A0A2T0WQT9_9BACT|nr:hypothetical protein CLW00_10314 [Mongoliibacter ruber]